MKEVIKYFDSLQAVVNILSFKGNTAIESVERGLAQSFDLMESLSMENLYSESIEPKRVLTLIKVSRIKSKKDGIISFLDVEQSKVEEWIERLVNAYPIYKEFHQVCENGGDLKPDNFEIPIIDGEISLTEAHILPEFFIEKKSELLSLLAEHGITLSESDKKVEGLRLPRELDTDRARKYFTRAIEKGFILPTSTGFKWVRATKKGEGVNTLIALLGGMIYCGDEVIKSRYGDKWQLGNGGIFPDEELKQLFGVKSLGAIRTNGLDSSRQKTAPRGWEDISALFED